MILDFSILESSDKHILFVDDSCYDEMAPDSPTVKVWFPSLSAHYSALVRPGEINILNTKNLGYGKEVASMPDGIYTLEYEVNYALSVTKKHVKFSRAKASLNKYLTENELNQDVINKMYKIDIMMQAAEAIVNIDKNAALDYYNTVTKEISKLNC